MAHPVRWFEIGGPNGRELHAFYETVFGWKLEPTPGPGDMMMAAKEGDGIPGGIMTSQHGQKSVSVYVGVGDIDAQVGKIERAGGRLVTPKMELPNDMGFIAHFHDPAGNMIGLWASSKKPAAATKRTAKAVEAKAAHRKKPAKKPARAAGKAKAKAKAKKR